MRNCFTALFILLFPLSLLSQSAKLSEKAEISVLTVGPGEMLNDAFGHNGFRVKDESRRLDVVFNYGVYDFGAPNFYLKFARGKLNYKMGVNYYDDFYQLYTYQDRTIQEQVLNLSQQEKQEIFDFLNENYKPENRYYLYDFFYDNCATKMRDVLVQVFGEKLKFNTPPDLQERSFRGLIYEHVDRNSWGSFGIDLALGSVIDKTAEPYEYMFLPKYINEFFDHAQLPNGDKLVSESRTIYEAAAENREAGFLFSPLVILGLLAGLILWITYADQKNSRRSKWLDLSIFLITGFAGIILLLLWFAT
ncbi:MAG: DUF4105 domain-containing protein, partial [Bacteroidia bacterium]|nr:DUF4105 domain-containing protein [Bacteroidia bacterium]